ncbi:MASE3 domain-containing protein [Clostridium sp. OS1-26]|uniref:MASE3 domain-containing protein n=1 Tax=Clostridium sp. OS1-26 TaxID=3070681 RepID=UPI0027DEEFD4|nr:MASE3 domain-containing protein [Clostridium sp. OS1-26]WML37826.1 MASE3 domain-containing protein [Clostridium sp. OS1-26]
MLRDIISFNSTNSMKSLIIKSLTILTVSFLTAIFIHNTVVKYLNVYCTVLELTCVFIALSIFISVWYLYNRNPVSYNVLGFGFLAVAIFDVLHILYYLNLAHNQHFDISSKFWVLGRATESIVLFLSMGLVRIKLKKLISLFITMSIVLGVSYLVVVYNNYLPILLTNHGATPIKIILEYGIICMYIMNLYSIKDKIEYEGVITYKYIFMSLFMSISTEFCFTLYTTVDSISWTIGHILKVISYYFLFKGIFISTILYPYEQLETEHKNLEKTTKELKHTSETLKDLFDALPIAVKEYDLNGKVRYVNKKFEELFACNRDGLYGITNEEFLKKFPSKLLENRKDTKNIVRTYKNLKGDNIKLSINSKRVRNGVLVFFSDTKKDQELENLHIQTETILKSIDNCILMFDKSGKVVLCNKALEEVLETSREDIIGMNISRLKKLIKVNVIEPSDLTLKDNTKKRLYHVALYSLKGNKKDMLFDLTAIRNVDGDIIGSISIGTDITEFKKEQQKLIQQEKLALLGQMGAEIVHETRNFLTTIKGRSKLISDVTQKQEVKKHALKINEEVDEVNRIISEFLFLSKPRETELMEVSMIDIFQSIKSMVKSSSLVKGIDVDFQLSKEERYVMCDEAELKQVILNICKNAVDAMTDKSNAKLKVETGFKESENEMSIRITDNGVGISEENLKKIGTPFFTTKRSGTGLGLNVCYKIIKEHKGRIEIESTLGEGTTFSIILPCIDDIDDEELI